MWSLTVAIPVLGLLALVTSLPTPGTENIDLLMPKVKPQTPDTYLCTAMEIKDKNRYITGFIPNANAKIAHHVLLYGCKVPGQKPGQVWNCGEMSSSNEDFELGPVCREGQNIVYAWAMEAPSLSLPQDVGFDVGQDTEIPFLVVQVHYKNVTKFLPPENGDDSSGLTLETTLTPTQKQAGVYLLSTGGHIPAHSIEYFEAACPYLEREEIVPFAYRTHAHSLGRVISGYRVRDGLWEELGRKDPRLPEMFYNVTTPGLVVKQGDILAARCTMENTLDHDVQIGATQNDEMCNFYIMYYVNRPPIPRRHSCFTPGPPVWYFPSFRDRAAINPAGIPSTASVIPGSEKSLRRNASYLAVETSDPEVEDVVEGLPGRFEDGEDSSLNFLLNEAVGEMDPAELEYLVEQLAEEEAEEERMNQMWQQRQYQRWLRQQQQEVDSLGYGQYRQPGPAYAIRQD